VDLKGAHVQAFKLLAEVTYQGKTYKVTLDDQISESVWEVVSNKMDAYKQDVTVRYYNLPLWKQFVVSVRSFLGI
jgi:hypothetical protein